MCRHLLASHSGRSRSANCMLPHHPIVWASGVEQNKRLTTGSEAVLCQPLKILLLRAVTFFKDLISRNACELLSGNLPSVWIQRQGSSHPTPGLRGRHQPISQESGAPLPMGGQRQDEGNFAKEMQSHGHSFRLMLQGSRGSQQARPPGWGVSSSKNESTPFPFL